MALFENYERRIDKINGVLAQYGISSVEEKNLITALSATASRNTRRGQLLCFLLFFLSLLLLLSLIHIWWTRRCRRRSYPPA